MLDMVLRRLRGGRRSLKWALVWAAVALLAAPAVGKYIDKQGK
ncbi:hypothetical protein [Pleomorphomonas sp. PLEO]